MNNDFYNEDLGIAKANSLPIKKIFKLDAPDEIKNEAIDIFKLKKSDKNIKKMFPKGYFNKRLIFISMFEAYKNKGVYIDPIYLAYLIDLKKEEIDHAFIECGYSNDSIPFDKMLEYYVCRLETCLNHKNYKFIYNNIKESFCDIINELKKDSVGEEYLKNTSKKSLIIAILYFYFETLKKIKIENKIYSKAWYYSWAQIINSYKIFISKYNN